jgi:hypothetical protein
MLAVCWLITLRLPSSYTAASPRATRAVAPGDAP